MDKIDVLNKMRKEKFVSVIRMDDAEKAIDVVKQISEGGINLIEITLTVPKAIEIISKLSAYFDGSDTLIGAGTVLDEISCREAILAGAEYIISPNFDKGVARICNLYRKVYIPGVFTPEDVQAALEWGCDILKLFPATMLKPRVIKDLKAPFPQANFIISGGMSKDNVNDWLDAGAMCIALGGALTRASGEEGIIGNAKYFSEIAKNYNNIK
jgi:2-dehydro-3-deoxyphosphogluconate aldolase/(4S)-4-hydroxy-2-oxoglutarate aldolase